MRDLCTRSGVYNGLGTLCAGGDPSTSSGLASFHSKVPWGSSDATISAVSFARTIVLLIILICSALRPALFIAGSSSAASLFPVFFACSRPSGVNTLSSSSSTSWWYCPCRIRMMLQLHTHKIELGEYIVYLHIEGWGAVAGLQAHVMKMCTGSVFL